MKKKSPWDRDMPSAQELWDTQFSWHHIYETEKRMHDGDPGKWSPQKVGKEFRVTIDGEYIYYKRKKDAKAALAEYNLRK